MTVSAEIRDGRIMAVVPRAQNAKAKAVAGYKAEWDKTGAYDRFLGWSYPLSWGHCVALRRTFGNDLKLGPQLTEWAWAERERRDAMELMRAGKGIGISRVASEAPTLWSALESRPFQIAGTAFIHHGKHVCLGDDPRLGKTYQALAALVEGGYQTILIGCPRTATRSVWRAKILELVGPDEQVFVAQEDRSNREQVMKEFASATGRRWLVINKEMIRVMRRFYCPDGTEWRIKPGRKNGCQATHQHKTKHIPFFPQVHKSTYDAIVLDECHHVLASTKNVMSDNISQIRYGAMQLKLADDGLKLATSGTPFRASLKNAWGVLNWLRPDLFRSFWQFADRHWGVKEGRYGKVIGSHLLDPVAFDEEIRPFYLARTLAEVAPQLPSIVYAGTAPETGDGGPGVYLEMSDKQARAYDEIVEDGITEIEDGRLMANGVLAELTRMRQFASAYGKLSDGKFIPTTPSNKLDWVLQFCEEREATGLKVVIASGFTKLVNMFADELRKKYRVVILTGETSDRGREQVQDQFQNGSAQIIVINTMAGGEAIDLSAADELVMLDEPWTDDPRQQVENRIRNLAKRNQLTVYRLRSERTIEDYIASLTEDQRRELLAAKPKALAHLKEAS